MKRRKSSGGFTIMEILLVVLLLFYLVYTTFTTVRELLDSKLRIDYRTDMGQVSRSLWSVMDRDLRSAFYLTAEDLGWNPMPLTQKEIQDGVAPPVKPIPQTLFQGTRDQLLFSTRSHQRMSQDVPENEQHFVRLLVEREALLREESLRAISRDDISSEKNFRKFTLVEAVSSLEFEYYNPERDRWEEVWDTNKAETLDRLPGAIRFKVVFTPKSDDPEAKPVPVTVESTVRITQRIYKEGPFAMPSQQKPQQAPGQRQ